MNKNILAIIAFLGMQSLAGAAVQVTQSSTAPTEDLIRQASGYNSEALNWGAYGTTWRDIGQAFVVPGDFNLEAFTFQLLSVEAQALGAAFTINIFETDASGTALQNGQLKATQHGILPNALAEGEFITFTLDATVALSAGKYYTVMLHFDGIGTSTAMGSRRLIKFAMGDVVGENPLGDKSVFWRSGNADFETYARGDKLMTSFFQGSAIPEGGSVALVLGGGLLAAAVYRPGVKRWLRGAK